MDIILRDIILWGHHGVSALEQQTGTEFKVDITLSLRNDQKPEQLEDTVDYVRVYEILKREFDQPEQLLETLVHRVSDAIIQPFKTQIASLHISILKIDAPIPGFNGKVGVSLEKKIDPSSP